MLVLVIHTVLGYSWDEIASIMAIMGTVGGFAYWLSLDISKRDNKSRAEHIYKPLAKIQNSVEKLASDFHRHSTISAKKFVHMKDRDDNFDKRLTTLENQMTAIMNKFK